MPVSYLSFGGISLDGVDMLGRRADLAKLHQAPFVMAAQVWQQAAAGNRNAAFWLVQTSTNAEIVMS